MHSTHVPHITVGRLNISSLNTSWRRRTRRPSGNGGDSLIGLGRNEGDQRSALRLFNGQDRGLFSWTDNPEQRASYVASRVGQTRAHPVDGGSSRRYLN